MGVMFVLIFGFYSAGNDSSLPAWFAALWHGIDRVVFTSCVAWVVFACVTGNGGKIVYNLVVCRCVRIRYDIHRLQNRIFCYHLQKHIFFSFNEQSSSTSFSDDVIAVFRTTRHILSKCDCIWRQTGLLPDREHSTLN